jgi:hypothetical protein
MDILRQLFGPPSQNPFLGSAAGLPAPVHRKVFAIIHNPILRTRGGERIQKALRWNDPDSLAQGYIDDLRRCSYGYANFEITERVVVDGYPVKADGFVYTEQAFLAAWLPQRGFHQPDGVDYPRLVKEFDLISKIDRGDIDEVWLLGFPYCGYWESCMAGPGAFWCNGPVIPGTDRAARRFVVMGFNYERGVGEMLEDFGHRTESILSKVFENTHGEANLFDRFLRYDKKVPGRAEVGNVHFAPNSDRDYDWGNPHPVPSRAETWRNFPNLEGSPRMMTCADWGNGDIREHHRWWLSHLPHVGGEINGIACNWWQYVVDPNWVR